MNRKLIVVTLLLVVAILASACGATPEPQVVEKVVTQEVEKTVIQTVKVEKKVVETVEVEKVVTATPAPVLVETGEENVVEGGHVTIGMWSAPDSFNPINTTTSYGGLCNSIMWESLLRYDDEAGYVGRLAESWEVSDDYTTFTFHLDPAAKWHDGEPVTAEDVEFAIWAITHPEIESSQGTFVSMLKGLEGTKRPAGVDKVEGVKVIDEHTIQFITAQPTDPLAFYEPMGIWVRVVPKHIMGDVAPADFNNDPFWQNPVIGSGPFKFVRYETDQFVEFERNDDYYLGRPHLDKLIISIVTPATMVAQLEKGELDVTASAGIGDVPLDDWERVQSLPNVNAYSYEADGHQYMTINVREGRPWTDVRLRHVLAYAINKQLMVDRLLKSEGSIAEGVIVPSTVYYNPAVEGKYRYDPEKAKALLAEVGWDPDYEVNLVLPTGNVVRELSSDIIQANLAEIGMKVKIEKMDWAALNARTAEGTFDLALSGWGGVLDPGSVQSIYGTGFPFNNGAFSSPVIDDLLDRGAGTADTQERMAIYNEFQIKFLEEMPAIPLYWSNRLAAVSNRAHNVRHIIGGYHSLTRNVVNWWVEDGQ